MKRVVVTGIGAITPYGQNENFFDNLVAGVSAVTSLKGFQKKSLTYCHIAGQVHDFRAEDFLPAKTANRMDRFIQMAAAASFRAGKMPGCPMHSKTQTESALTSVPRQEALAPLKVTSTACCSADPTNAHHLRCPC